MSLPESQKSMMIIHSFRHSTGIGRTDRRTNRIGKTISHPLCIGWWCAI